MTLIINNWDKYNKLTILKEINGAKDLRTGLNIRKVLCGCECWNKTEVRLAAVTNWHIKSCWCINRWVTRDASKPNKDTLKRRKIKEDLNDIRFYTTMYFNSWFFSVERKIAKQKLLELIKENGK
jgi:hypothetical protein